jgi:putative ABC transport system ATP-binding protein
MNNDIHLIELHGTGKDYGEGDTLVRALDRIDLVIDDGEFVAIMGQSGSGKSTLLSILGGLNRPSRGRVLMDTLDVYTLTGEQRADFRSEYVGIVFQSFQLIPYLTVLENVMLPLSITGTRKRIQEKNALDALARVKLKDKAHRLPDQLSGGEQERVAISRAIVNQPPILLADEPTGSLDTETAEEVLTLLKQLNRDGQTVIMVTHNPDMCRHASRTIFLKDGRVAPAPEPVDKRMAF